MVKQFVQDVRLKLPNYKTHYRCTRCSIWKPQTLTNCDDCGTILRRSSRYSKNAPSKIARQMARKKFTVIAGADSKIKVLSPKLESNMEQKSSTQFPISHLMPAVTFKKPMILGAKK